MLKIAVIPSNQDRNITIGGDSELAHVKSVADELARVLSAVPGIEVKLIEGTPESEDAFPYQGLRAQQVNAREFLGTGGDRLALNLHTDAGLFSHVGYYYRDEAGRRLGEEIGAMLKVAFSTDRVLHDNYGDYIFVLYQRPETTALLLELGSHQNQHDYDYLNQNYKTVALIIRDAICNFFGIEIPSGVDWSEIGFYTLWAGERIRNREDPRDSDAFREHLRAVGKDASNPRKYGWPCNNE